MLLVFVNTLVAMGPGELRITNSVTRNDLLEAIYEGRTGAVESRELEVTAKYADGKEELKTFVILYEPRSQFYLWALVGAPREIGKPDWLGLTARLSSIAVGNGRIAWFIGGYHHLAIVESIHRASNFEEAYLFSLREATQQLSVLETAALKQFTDVDIRDQIHRISVESKEDFYLVGMSFFVPLFPVHVQASYVGAGWEVLLEANLKAKVILDKRYEVIHAEQIPGHGPASSTEWRQSF